MGGLSVYPSPPHTQRGTATTSGTATLWTGTVTFPVPFPSPPAVVMTGLGTPGGNTFIVWSVTSITATGFSWRASWNDLGSHSNAGSASWIAEA